MADPTVIIDFEPDWSSRPALGYAFQTVIQPTPYFVEQRRPLLPEPSRTLSCKYVFQDVELQRARNRILYGISKLCCIPIYSEPIQAAAITGSSITATNDITYFWNIQNCDYAVILDFLTGQSEMVKVSSVAGQVISLSAPIVKSWTVAQTIIYPAFAGKISSSKEFAVTDKVGGMEVDFEEITAESGVATKAWVGLEEWNCILITTGFNFQPFILDTEGSDLLDNPDELVRLLW